MFIGFGPGGDEYLGQHYRPSDDDLNDNYADDYVNHHDADDYLNHHYDDQCCADDDTARSDSFNGSAGGGWPQRWV